MKNSALVSKKFVRRSLQMAMTLGAMFILCACSIPSTLNLRSNDSVVKTGVQTDSNGFQLLGDELIFKGAKGHVEDCLERSASEDLYFDASSWAVWQVVPQFCANKRLVIDSVSLQFGGGENDPSITLMLDAEASTLIGDTSYILEEIDGAYVVTILEGGELGELSFEAHKFSTAATVTVETESYCGDEELFETFAPVYLRGTEIIGFDFAIRSGGSVEPETDFIWDEAVPSGVRLNLYSSATSTEPGHGWVTFRFHIQFDAAPGTFSGVLEAKQGDGPSCKVGVTLIIPDAPVPSESPEPES